MKSKPPTGTTGSLVFTVESSHCIDFAGNGLPAVLSTPVLIGFLERTARQTVAPFLQEGEVTLGTSVELNHLAPASLGSTVTCRARVVHVDGAKISFQIEARDDQEPLAKGFHTRAAVAAHRIAKRVARKQR